MDFFELFRRDVEIVRDIDYGGDGDVRHKLDVYRKPDAARQPVVMWMYGGGWRSGDKRLFEHLGRALALRNAVVVVINYRHAPDHRYPDQPQDVAAAVRWVRDNIVSHGGDPDSIFLTGHSAGAHLAALVALDVQFLEAVDVPPQSVTGVVAISGAMDLANHIDSTVYTTREQIEEAFGSSRDTLRAASPIEHVRSDSPPFLIVVAERDSDGLQQQARAMLDVLRNHDVLARLVTVNDRDHLSIIRRFGPSDDAAASAMGEFVRRVSRRASASNSDRQTDET